jgi:hypothetical protein
MYEEIEAELGIQIPCALKYKDPNGIHAALLICDKTGEVLAYGINKHICPKTKPHGQTRYTVHAEQELLNNFTRRQHQIKSKMRGAMTLLSVRFSQTGVCGNSRVCKSCAQIVSKKFGNLIRKVKYMDSSKNWQETSVEQACDIAVTSSGDKRTVPPTIS